MRLSADTRYVRLVRGLAVLRRPGGSPCGGAFATSVVALGVIVTGIGLGLAGGAPGKVVRSHLVGPPHR